MPVVMAAEALFPLRGALNRATMCRTNAAGDGALLAMLKRISMPDATISKITIQRAVRPVTLIESQRLAKKLATNILIASETFQHTGSFKFRAAYNVASSVPNRLLIAASSGNFGQALAYACALLNKSCIVVMPATSVRVKVDAVREYGGQVELVDVAVKSRQERVSELAREHPEAYVASAYDDPLVIQGNSTLGQEVSALNPLPDVVVVPVGGGGLSAGIISGIGSSGKKIQVIGAEPLIANDAARSLKAGKIIRNEAEPRTIADGARTLSLGEHNWRILQRELKDIVEVPEEMIVEAVRLLFRLANLKAEPTGALSIAAVMTAPELFRDRSVCCVVSGGNVDPSAYTAILGG
ncbi:MAG TPA: pyridoxal-phosphate dependent enzyme [Candidatus Acidoferrales bacterium]|nr:pyridoxal-phosphate dependent enzyme [Candidatus Acidoferrales bacterium]